MYYLAEFYVAGGRRDHAELAGRATAAAAELAREGTAVRFLRAIFLPEDETGFALYEAPSVQAVADAGERAQLPFDRIRAAVTRDAELESDPLERRTSMFHAGDTIENPVTGERIVFRKTSRDTGGEFVAIECYVQPDGFVATAHVHPSQEERFEVLRGTVGFRIGRKKIVAGPGQRLTVPAGTPHKFWNAGDEVAHFACEVRPARQFESLIETMFALAADGKTNRKGMPNPLRLAVIARAHFDTVQLPFPPAFLQRIGLAMGAPLGRALGYEPVYVPSAATPATATV
jgi:mannose-6-phosphate isomerase-like protein (cupin superfamily)